MAKLTKRVVDAAEASNASVFIWDDGLKGRDRRWRQLMPR
jgi:hypothetical protein